MTSAFREAEALAATGDVDAALACWECEEAAALDEVGRARWALLFIELGASPPESLISELRNSQLRGRILEVAGDSLLGCTPGNEGAELTSSSADLVTDVGPDWLEDATDLDFGREVTSADERVVSEFLRWFGGRRDLYARQWHDDTRRRTGYHPVRQPLDPDVARAHLAGRITIGQYLLFPDATVSLACIDLDLGASSLADLRAEHGNDVCPLQHDGLRSYALRLIQSAGSLGLPLFPEDSGGKGLHLWLFLVPRRPARAARALLAQIIAAAGPQPADVGLELFPKQDGPGARGLSSLVKLPLGIHRATLRPCPLLDDSLQPISAASEALSRLRPADPALVDAIVGRRIVALPAPELQAVDPAPELQAVQSPRSLAEALRAIRAGEEARSAAERILRGCPVLAALVRKAYEERRLTPDEARAIVYTLGLLGEKAEVADDALRAANVGLKELERARRGLPSPSGCSRIRKLASAGRVCSGCPSGSAAVPYPTPCLFAVGNTAPAEPRHRPFAPWLDADETVVQGPLDALGGALARIEERLDRMERGEPRSKD